MRLFDLYLSWYARPIPFRRYDIATYYEKEKVVEYGHDWTYRYTHKVYPYR